MNNYEYSLEKLEATVRSLAIGPDDVRIRLIEASSIFWPLKADDFPEELRSELSKIKHDLSKREPEYDHHGEVRRGSIEETLRHMHKKTAARIAERIVKLKERLEYFLIKQSNKRDESAL